MRRMISSSPTDGLKPVRRFQLRDIRGPALHILEPRLVRLLVGARRIGESLPVSVLILSARARIDISLLFPMLIHLPLRILQAVKGQGAPGSRSPTYRKLLVCVPGAVKR